MNAAPTAVDAAEVMSFAYEAVERSLEATGDVGLLTPLRDISQIERAASAAAQLTRQLLTFARRDMVRPQLLVQSEPGLLPVLADPVQLQQVLVNLAINARQAMPHGGVLLIGTRNERDEQGSWVQLTVSDTGVGMEETTLLRAFEPFFTTRAADQGTGLGLSTVYGIVSQAGGTATLNSVVGRGTTFTARFPATVAASEAVAVAGAQVAGKSGVTVLVVDDEHGIREVVERILLRHGYTVLLAGGGVEAVRIARERTEPIEVLLTDVIMPDLNGPDLSAALLALRPDLRIVYMSGYAGADLAARIAMDRDVQLVPKPFTEAQLLAALDEVLGS